MSTELSKTTRQIVLGIVIIGALLMIFAVPPITQGMQNMIVTKLTGAIAKGLATGTPESLAKASVQSIGQWQIAVQHLVWANLTFIAGIIILAVIKEFYDGKAWARGLVLMSFAICSITGAYTSVQWINLVMVQSKQGGFPPFGWTLLIGLIPFFSVVLATNKSRAQKTIDFFAFLLTGVVSGVSFIIGYHAAKALYAFKERPIMEWNAPSLWVAMTLPCILLIIAIYQFGAGKKSAWYTAYISALTILVASVITYFIMGRAEGFYLGTLAGGLVLTIFLLIPAVKKQYLPEIS